MHVPFFQRVGPELSTVADRMFYLQKMRLQVIWMEIFLPCHAVTVSSNNDALWSDSNPRMMWLLGNPPRWLHITPEDIVSTKLLMEDGLNPSWEEKLVSLQRSVILHGFFSKDSWKNKHPKMNSCPECPIPRFHSGFYLRCTTTIDGVLVQLAFVRTTWHHFNNVKSLLRCRKSSLLLNGKRGEYYFQHHGYLSSVDSSNLFIQMYLAQSLTDSQSPDFSSTLSGIFPFKMNNVRDHIL